MNNNYKTNITLCFLILLGILQLNAQQTYTFTNANVTGMTGPNQTQINTAYQLTNLNGSVTIATQGIQQFTIPTSGGYRIHAIGAQGYGPFGGRGASMSGDFTLTAGTVLKILVGQEGIAPTGGTNQHGGGGGSFVTLLNNTPLVVAGGGGGSWASGFTATTDGTTTTSGNDGANGPTNGVGGTNGSGGAVAGLANGGAGITGNGAGTSPAMSFINGGAGGGSTGRGGFGGGGGASSQNNRRSGGGGGYSGGGGAGSTTSGFPEGGGGGSFNSGSNQVNVAGANTGMGRVIITELCSITLSVNGVASNSTICSGNTVTLTTNAISGYSWSTNSTAPSITVAPTTTTVYSLTATSPSNCVSSAMVTITVQNGLPVLTIANTANSNNGGVCPSKTVALTASGAITYTWTGASNVTNGVAFTPGSASGYTVVGENACGTSTAITSVSIHPIPNVSASATQPTLCSGTSVTLTGMGNANTYTWTGGAINGAAFMPTTTGDYTVTGLSTDNCSNTAVVSLTVVTTPVLAPVLSSSLICNGETATISASGAANYSWMPVNQTTSVISVTPNTTTTYTVTKWNANCSDTKVITLIVNQLPPVNAIPSSPTVCALNSTTLTSGGATNYTWYPLGGNQVTAVVNPASTTIYTVSANDGTCASSATVEVYVNPNPTISVTSSASDVCAGENITLNVSGAQTYTWVQTFLSGTTPTVSALTTTVYAVNGTNQYNCTSTGGVLILVKPLPVLNVSASRTLVCSGLPSTLTASGNSSSYSWAHGGSASNSTVTPTVSSVYTITGSDAFCSNTKTVSVAVFSPTFVVTPDTAICKGGSIVLGASGAFSYTWVNQPLGQYIQVSPTVSTTYSVIANVISPNNYVTCPALKTVSVGIYANPTITATGDRVQICRGEKVTLSAQGGQNYNWSNATSGQTISVSPFSETRYIVTGEDVFGCVNTGTVLVRVSVCPGMSERNGYDQLTVYPNPNSGVFMVEIHSDQVITINNILGQPLLTTKLIAGKNSISLLDQPAGVYILNVSSPNGEQRSYRIIKQ